MTRRRTLNLPALLVAAVLACVAALTTLLAVSREAESTFPGKNGKIAFVSTCHNTKTESGDIYTMNPNGAAVERLTNHPERDFEPAWSPDGTNRETEISRQDIVDLALIAALVAVGVYII